MANVSLKFAIGKNRKPEGIKIIGIKSASNGSQGGDNSEELHNEFASDIAELKNQIRQVTADVLLKADVANLENFVPKDGDKVLSDNNFSDSYKDTLNNLDETYASINHNHDDKYVKKVDGKDLFSGSYEDLTDKPSFAAPDHDHDGVYAPVVHEHDNYITPATMDAAISDSVNAAIAGAFKFIGSVNSTNDLPDSAAAGSVYQVDDKEYVRTSVENGEFEDKWVELGIAIDLQTLASKESVDDLINVVAGKASTASVENLAETINGIESSLANKAEISTLNKYVMKEDGKGLFSGRYADLTGAPDLPESDQIATKSDIASINTELSSKSDNGHTHQEFDTINTNIASLASGKANVADLNNYALKSHNHTASDITDFPPISELANKSYVDSAINTFGVNNVLPLNAQVTGTGDDTLNGRVIGLENALGNKVDAVEGKQLSDENFTAEDKAKLNDLQIALTNAISEIENLNRRLSIAEASISGGAVAISNPEADVDINVPLTNAVNITANNVTISNDITATDTSAQGNIQINASDTVTVGEK